MLQVNLGPQAERLVEEKLRTGQYDTPEAVVLAGLLTLHAQPANNFEPGEMQQLVDEGDRSIAEEGTVPAEQVFAGLRAHNASRRGRAG